MCEKDAQEVVILQCVEVEFREPLFVSVPPETRTGRRRRGVLSGGCEGRGDESSPLVFHRSAGNPSR